MASGKYLSSKCVRALILFESKWAISTELLMISVMTKKRWAREKQVVIREDGPVKKTLQVPHGWGV